MSIFDLEHIFIVFHPGAAGNFIASLLEKVLKNDTDTINVGVSGTAHTLINRKIAGIDYLSFGTEVDEQSAFKSENDRINFYLDKIKSEYTDVTTPQIIWSHDFTNIPLYKKFFPNSKILVITQESDMEKVAVVMFNVAKNILDLNTINPLTEKRRIEVMRMWNHGMRMELVHLLGESKTRTLDKNSKLVRYVAFSRMLRYYKLDKLLDSPERQPDLVNTVLYPSKELLILGKTPYTIGKDYSEYTEGCIKLPFMYLMQDDTNTLLSSLSNIVDLNEETINIILNNYKKYRSAQNQEILSNPLRYYAKLKEEILKEKQEK
jgi:hypothetical protein